MENKKRFTPLKIFLVFAVIALLAGIGWYFYNNNAPGSSTASAKYENKNLGFKFSYPSSWGEVSSKTKDANTTLTFSKNNKFVFGLVSKNGNPTASAGGCYTTLGFTEEPSLRERNFDEQYSKATSYYLVNTDRVKIVEGFEYYDFDFEGETSACPGLWFDSAVMFSKNAKFSGVEGFWRQLSQEECCQGPSLDNYSAYKQDRTTQFSDEQRQEITNVIQSIEEL